MNWLGIILIVFGVLYLVYAVKLKNKVTIYFRTMDIVKEKEEEYLKLQLYFSILNAFLAIIIGILVIINSLDNIYVIVTPLIFHLVNFIMKIISKTKGYVEA